MSERKHVVEKQGGVSFHREIPASRKSEDFCTYKVSEQSRAAFRRVCVSGDATPDDYRHVLSAVMGRAVVDEILNL